MIQELIKALTLIFVAEMGDKTQILAMAFATKFKVKKVLIGIGIGSLLNHGLAVILGSMLTKLVPINTIQMIAGIAFIVFSLWTLKSDDYDEEDEVKIKFGPTFTVALAFFLGELGDKTQLTAVTLAVDASYPLMILMGTVLGMIVTGGLGIFIGKKLGDKIPEIAIKIIAATVFMIFGLQKLYTTLPGYLINPLYIIPFTLIIGCLMAYMLRVLFKKRNEGIISDYNMKSKILHDYYEHIHKDLVVLCDLSDELMMDPNDLDSEDIALRVEDQLNHLTARRIRFSKDKTYSFSKAQVLDSLIDTLWVIEHVKNLDRLSYAHQIRRELERILLGYVSPDYKEIESYVSFVKQYDESLASLIRKQYRMRLPLIDRIINLGNQSNNMYLIEIESGYLMIDTGLKDQYKKFLATLDDQGIDRQDIKYIFITHAHKDHVGFLKDMLEETQAQVILHSQTATKLRYGENSYEGGFSNSLAWLFYQSKRLLTKRSHKFDIIDQEDRYIIVADQSDLKSFNLDAKVLELPGHTKDSIGLVVEEKVLFCGDAAVNRITGQHNIIHWIENARDYKKSWTKMINTDFKMVYPTHGKPFSKDELIKNKKKVNSIKIR